LINAGASILGNVLSGLLSDASLTDGEREAVNSIRSRVASQSYRQDEIRDEVRDEVRDQGAPEGMAR
jgi:hypothetical protein